jgi:PAS domain S-box-containing protein
MKASYQDLVRRVKELEQEAERRKEVEESLRVSEERFRELAELLPETVFEMDTEGKLVFVNRKGFDCFGYTPEDFQRGMNAFEVLATPLRSWSPKIVKGRLKTSTRS